MPGRRSALPSLSSKEALILELLGRSGEMYGLELVAAAGGERRGDAAAVASFRLKAAATRGET